MNKTLSAWAALAVAACSSSSPDGHSDGGASDGPSGRGDGCHAASPHAAVYVTSTIGPSAAFATEPCQLATITPELQIGTVASSVMSGTESTTVSCSVVKSGSGYAVSADVVSGSGSFAISGKMPASGTGSGITASLDYSGAGTAVRYTGTHCTVALADATTPGYSPSAGPPIAPDRVWATVTCDDMTVSGQPGHVCQGVLLFRLESCAFKPGCP